MDLTHLATWVSETAKKAAEQSRRVNLGDLWERLLDIETEAVQERIAALRPHGWPGAIPAWESLSTCRSSSSQPAPLIGVDGSQVYPDPDQPVRWGYIQAATYPARDFKRIEGQFVEIQEAERYKVVDDDGNKWDPMTYVNTLRTLLETQVAKAAAAQHPEAVILLDNSLLPFLWAQGVLPQQIEVYTQMIASMRGAMLAGYTSSPRSHLLYNLIRLTDEDLDFPQTHCIAEDAQIMRYGLAVGQRSALFLHGSRRNFSMENAGAGVYLFFLKISETEVARVEVPEWVARSNEMLDRIQASILYDCRVHHYPEVLLLAHQRVAILLKIGWRLNQLAMEVYLEHGGYYCVPAKKYSKRQRWRL